MRQTGGWNELVVSVLDFWICILVVRLALRQCSDSKRWRWQSAIGPRGDWTTSADLALVAADAGGYQAGAVVMESDCGRGK